MTRSARSRPGATAVGCPAALLAMLAAPDPAARERAGTIARGIPGVGEVPNRIAVLP